jgi:hypothetical protein
MVMNYKDSIKAEMELSAMLGKSINLSEVRAKFASSDIPGAVKALQDELGGIDLSSLDFFSKDAISQSLGGMDFDEIARIGSGNYGEIAKNTKDLDQGIDKSSKAVIKASIQQTNNQRLNIEYSIAETKAMNAAAIQAQASIAQQQIENQKALNNVMIDNDYLQLKANLAFLRSIQTELPGALISGLVAGLTTFLPQILKGAWGMITGKGASTLVSGITAESAATAGAYAAGAAGIFSFGQSAYDIYDKKALRGNGYQTTGNYVAGVGADFMNVANLATFGGIKALSNATGTTIPGISIRQLEHLRGAYRQDVGQIGVGSESNQKLAEWTAANAQKLIEGGLGSDVADLQKAVQDGLYSINTPFQTAVTTTATGVQQEIKQTAISSIDDIEKQATEAYKQSKSSNSKITADTSKSITDMTKKAITATATTTAAGTTTPNGTPTTATAANIRTSAVYDVNSEIGANTAIKIYSLLEAWSTKSTGGTQVYLDSTVINDKLRESAKAKRAMYVVQ